MFHALRSARWLLTGLLTLVGVPPALAGGFTVSPVLISLEAGQRSTAVTLTSGSDQPQRIQAEVYRWSRVNGVDVLEPEPRLLLNPPLFDLAPGAAQVVRLGFKAQALPSPERESAYRVIFQEVPHPEAGGASQLNMVLRVSVPAFAAPRAPQRGQAWKAYPSEAGLQLEFENRGNVHLRVANLRVRQPPSGEELTAQGFVYVFPGQTQRWTLPAQVAAGSPLLVDVLSDDGPLHVELPVQPAP